MQQPNDSLAPSIWISASASMRRFNAPCSRFCSMFFPVGRSLRWLEAARLTGRLR